MEDTGRVDDEGRAVLERVDLMEAFFEKRGLMSEPSSLPKLQEWRSSLGLDKATVHGAEEGRVARGV